MMTIAVDERSERQRTDKDSRNPTTRTSPTDASVDLQRVIWILTATPQTVIHSLDWNRYGPARIKGPLRLVHLLLHTYPHSLKQLPILLTTTKPLVKKKSSNSPKPQQRLVTNSHKPEARKSFIAPQSDACKDQVSTTLVPDQQVNEEASEDQRLVSSRARKPSFFAQQRSCNGLMIEQNTKDVQEHTCPVETIGQTMLNVSQNQSHFECPIVQELTKPVVVDVALLNHVVSQDKGWTECPIVSESHYKHGMGAVVDDDDNCDYFDDVDDNCVDDDDDDGDDDKGDYDDCYDGDDDKGDYDDCYDGDDGDDDDE
ncbi:hypothetical protein BY996DRAFT_6602444 [Phakopsora pachyrhizi]|nr:hypothetical protein BY996DRAFT_6602444 [Phakopsora pachyrhizi]